MQKRCRRRNILPNPSLQLRIVGLCLFFAACSGLVQAILGQRFIAEILAVFPQAAEVHRAHLWLWHLRQFCLSLAILFPFVLGLGILVTFRYAGPMVNMKNHLRRIANGEDPGPCRLRKGDQLHDLAEAINQATAALRAAAARTAAPGSATAAAAPPAPASAAPPATDDTFETTTS